MAEKGTKKGKPKAGEGVLASLPATRPNRMATRRRDTAEAAPKPTATAVAAKTKAKSKPAPRKPRAVKAAPKPTPIATGAPVRPKPVRSASKPLAGAQEKAATKRAPASPREQPSGTELVSTVVQAAGELAQVGLSIGGQVLKRAVERLPKP